MEAKNDVLCNTKTSAAEIINTVQMMAETTIF